MDPVTRAANCGKCNLCFVSLKPLVKDGFSPVKHSIAGIVPVNNEYINPKKKYD